MLEPSARGIEDTHTRRAWREFRTTLHMATQTHIASVLRAEARLMSVAGMLLLAAAFPFTLYLAVLALVGDHVSALTPLVAGAPPILLGYCVCHRGAYQLQRARKLDPSVR